MHSGQGMYKSAIHTIMCHILKLIQGEQTVSGSFWNWSHTMTLLFGDCIDYYRCCVIFIMYYVFKMTF